MAESEKPAPVVKRLSPRRVRTLPVEGQMAEPDPEQTPPPSQTSGSESDERLKADKPPHY